MKAPDKIYVNPDLDCPWTGEGCFGDVEYIRKDALIEWAEDIKAKTGWYEIEVAMDDLIDKLNSM